MSQQCEFHECDAAATHTVKHHIAVSGVRCLAAEIPACLDHARLLVRTGFGDEIDGPVPSQPDFEPAVALFPEEQQR